MIKLIHFSPSQTQRSSSIKNAHFNPGTYFSKNFHTSFMRFDDGNYSPLSVPPLSQRLSPKQAKFLDSMSAESVSAFKDLIKDSSEQFHIELFKKFMKQLARDEGTKGNVISEVGELFIERSKSEGRSPFEIRRAFSAMLFALAQKKDLLNLKKYTDASIKEGLNVVEPIFDHYLSSPTPDATSALQYFNTIKEKAKKSHYEAILNILNKARLAKSTIPILNEMREKGIWLDVQTHRNFYISAGIFETRKEYRARLMKELRARRKQQHQQQQQAEPKLQAQQTQ